MILTIALIAVVKAAPICSICLDHVEVDLVKTICTEEGHDFHQLCLTNWVNYQPTLAKSLCPLCRRDISIQIAMKKRFSLRPRRYLKLACTHKMDRLMFVWNLFCLA